MKIFIATPSYGGMTSAFYTKSMIRLTAYFAKNDIQFTYYAPTTESLITRARNYCVDEFLRSDSTHLIFIDADIEFEPEDVHALAQVSEMSANHDVVCGPYPLKSIAWEKVRAAVNKGVSDSDPLALDRVSVDFVFNIEQKPGETVKSFPLNRPLKVMEAGTGFMCIKRSVFDRLKDAHPEWAYYPDHIKTKDFAGDKIIYQYFNAEIDPQTKRYLSEDYKFCQDIAKLGMSVYVCPWMKLNHIGIHVYKGDLTAIAKAGLSYSAMKGI